MANISCVTMRSHGGECCGVRHLCDFFPRREKAQRDHLVKVDKHLKNSELKDAIRREELRGKMWEIVLTDLQIREMPILVQGLKDRGFHLVTRFHNSSGGWCNVLHRRPQNAIHSSPYWSK